MMLFRMAWRNLWRRKRRTLITSLTVAFGFMLAVTAVGAHDYGWTKMINISASMGFGHLSVEPEGYNESPSLDKRLTGADTLRGRILRTPGIQAAMTRIIGQAMFASASKNVGGTFIAIAPAHENSEYNIFLRSMVEGKLFTGAGGPEVVVGKKMAEKLNLRIGKKLVYTATDAHGEIVSDIARVTGIFKTGSDDVDGSVALLPIDRVRAALHYAPEDATMIAVFIADQRKADAARAALTAVAGGAGRDILTWEKTQAEVAGTMAIDRAINYLFLLFIYLLVAAGILDTILMSVLERTHEFGVMLAVGLPPGTLFRLVIAESFLIGLLGLALGLALNVPWYHYMHGTGIDFSALLVEGYETSGVPIDPIMKVDIYRENIIIIVGGLFALTLVSGLYPAYKASRVPPVESMKAA